MKKLTILLFSILISFNSYGYLQEIVKSDVGDTSYIYTDTVKEHSGYVYYWELGDKLKPSTTGNMSLKVYSQGDCVTSRFKRLSFEFYKQPMGRGRGDTYNPPGEWQYPPPGSLSRVILNWVCDYVK